MTYKFDRFRNFLIFNCYRFYKFNQAKDDFV